MSAALQPRPVPGLASLLAGFVRLLTGVVARWAAPLPAGPAVFYANHSSHLDAILLWALLPAERRASTRPVAARDYWMRGPLRRHLASRVFNAVLVARVREHPDPEAPHPAREAHQALEEMAGVLAGGGSLILFPEGTRGTGEAIAPFKSGLYHLAKARPETWFVPVHLENLNRILPKGESLPVPLIGKAAFGTAFRMEAGEGRSDFLERARRALEELSC